jgi:hypothetical protein
MQGRLRGALIGLAIGDALGAAVEFKPPGTFEPVDGYRSGGPHGLEPGEWTDDTSMALALADSMIHAGWDLEDQAKRYLTWWHQGKYSVNGRCFDIGNTVSSALSRFEATGDVLSCASTDERASGGTGETSAIRDRARNGRVTSARSASSYCSKTFGSGKEAPHTDQNQPTPWFGNSSRPGCQRHAACILVLPDGQVTFVNQYIVIKNTSSDRNRIRRSVRQLPRLGCADQKSRQGSPSVLGVMLGW